jgi:hypothetical protein
MRIRQYNEPDCVPEQNIMMVPVCNLPEPPGPLGDIVRRMKRQAALGSGAPRTAPDSGAR